ncbi:hypothetical protein KNV00_gp122 [Streptomyces phage Bmoc]|uniref:Uncharacterized protein n=1 Tax=Streptomyces phage Bmoc TaxID=2725629 RepID=A0A6M3SYN1_9CAUD|nr:hypothetical protein KNV00_gp122 [Streptomyces phage Bmoc]QJD50897.1 hypothetical protein SEA_BMOC_181 [Streptomyces phage Bmoc]
MPTINYQGRNGELTIESESHSVYGYETSWDKNWKIKDSAGHWHFYGSDDDPFPTLYSKPWKVYDEDNPDDEWEETKYFCKECHVEVTPKQTRQQVFKEIKGDTRYILTREVSEEEAMAWLQEQQIG